MNTEEETEQPDVPGIGHIALLLSREPVAQSIVARFQDEAPAYKNPALLSVFWAARALVASGQVPSAENIRYCLRKWDEAGEDGHADDALALLKTDIFAESKELDADAAQARAREYEAEMAPATEEPTTPPKFLRHRFEQLRARPKPEWLIANVLIAGKTSLLTAKEASFKSFFSLDMSLCISTGREWHGHKVVAGNVVYVAAEGASGLIERTQAWAIEHGLEIPDSFEIIEVPAQIHEPGIYELFIAELGDLQPALIVLDTLARNAVGLEENSAKEMGLFADAFCKLAKDTGAHVLTVHHNNKSGEYRGSSALTAAVDTHLSMTRNGEHVSLKCVKQKDSKEFEEMQFEQHHVDWGGSEGSIVFRRQYDENNPYGGLSGTEIKVLQELLESFGKAGASHTQWWKSVEQAGGVIERSFRRSKNKLLDAGFITCPDAGKRGAVFIPNMEVCEKFHNVGDK